MDGHGGFAGPWDEVLGPVVSVSVDVAEGWGGPAETKLCQAYVMAESSTMPIPKANCVGSGQTQTPSMLSHSEYLLPCRCGPHHHHLSIAVHYPPSVLIVGPGPIGVAERFPPSSLFDEGGSGLFSSNASLSLCLILFPLFCASPAMPGVLGRHPDCPRLYTLHSSYRYPLLIVPNVMSSPTLPLAFPPKSPSLNRLYADCVFGRLQLQHFRRIDDTTVPLTKILG